MPLSSGTEHTESALKKTDAELAAERQTARSKTRAATFSAEVVTMLAKDEQVPTPRLEPRCALLLTRLFRLQFQKMDAEKKA